MCIHESYEKLLQFTIKIAKQLENQNRPAAILLLDELHHIELTESNRILYRKLLTYQELTHDISIT